MVRPQPLSSYHRAFDESNARQRNQTQKLEKLKIPLGYETLKQTRVKIKGWFFSSKTKVIKIIAINKPLENSREILKTLHLQITDENKD